MWRSSKTSWSEERELAALQIEVVDGLRRAFIAAHSAKGAKPPEPVKIPRPWQKQEKAEKRGTPLAEMIREMRIPVRVSKAQEGGEQRGT